MAWQVAKHQRLLCAGDRLALMEQENVLVDAVIRCVAAESGVRLRVVLQTQGAPPLLLLIMQAARHQLLLNVPAPPATAREEHALQRAYVKPTGEQIRENLIAKAQKPPVALLAVAGAEEEAYRQEILREKFQIPTVIIWVATHIRMEARVLDATEVHALQLLEP